MQVAEGRHGDQTPWGERGENVGLRDGVEHGDGDEARYERDAHRARVDAPKQGYPEGDHER